MDPRAVDAAYKSFPDFATWAACRVDYARWNRYTAILAERGRASPHELKAAQEVVRRAAAVDTGAIEGLYEVDRGFTYTVAKQAAIWEAALDAKGPRTRALIESQLQAYEYVLDFATQERPITEAWVRTLHEELCRAQETYTVSTEVGPQTQRLPLGEYKHLPNHVRQADGTVHAYSPVDLVPAEMHRLCEVLRSEEFLAAHPVLQASYAHYAFILIHPFADGNGRVARALASVYTYRAQSVPVLILAESRKEYIDSLSAADRGDAQAFVDLMMERVLDSILLVNESLQAAMEPRPDRALAALDELYRTQGGYTQEEVTDAGLRLLEAMQQELQLQGEAIQKEGPRVQISTGISTSSGALEPPVPGFRVASRDAYETASISLQASVKGPLSARVHRTLLPLVPRDAGREDDVNLFDQRRKAKVFSARASELIPAPSATLQLRIRIAAERILGELLQELVGSASDTLKK